MPFPREVPKKRVPFNHGPPLKVAIALGALMSVSLAICYNTSIFKGLKTTRSLLGPDHPLTILEEAEREADNERRRLAFFGKVSEDGNKERAWDEVIERSHIASAFSNEEERRKVMENLTKD